MTTDKERAELREEIGSLLERGRHPWPMLTTALETGDREVAELVLEVGADKLSGREKVAATIKQAFPESTEEYKARTEAPSTSGLGEVLAQRNERRREQKVKLDTGKTYGGHGWATPQEGKTYATAEPGGFNTPIDRDVPQRRGFNQLRSIWNQPPGGDAA